MELHRSQAAEAYMFRTLPPPSRPSSSSSLLLLPLPRSGGPGWPLAACRLLPCAHERSKSIVGSTLQCCERRAARVTHLLLLPLLLPELLALSLLPRREHGDHQLDEPLCAREQGREQLLGSNQNRTEPTLGKGKDAD